MYQCKHGVGDQSSAYFCWQGVGENINCKKKNAYVIVEWPLGILKQQWLLCKHYIVIIFYTSKITTTKVQLKSFTKNAFRILLLKRFHVFALFTLIYITWNIENSTIACSMPGISVNELVKLCSYQEHTVTKTFICSKRMNYRDKTLFNFNYLLSNKVLYHFNK